MTRRRKLEHRLHSLAEVREIMNSMKTLAYMETKKLEHFIDAQKTVVESIEEVAKDFLHYHPETLPESRGIIPVYILIGTERGFCGDFNHKLLNHLESVIQASSDKPMFIAVGRKLYMLLEEDGRVVEKIDGAGVVEEVGSVLIELVNKIISIQDEYGSIDVFCLFYGSEGSVVMQRLLPPFQGCLNCPSRFSDPPLLYLSPTDFLIKLTDQYLFATLHTLLYTSLMEENHHRVSHLEGAVSHLDDRSDELKQKSNALRQEDIIEEIEVILLSAESLFDKPEKHDYDSL